VDARVYQRVVEEAVTRVKKGVLDEYECEQLTRHRRRGRERVGRRRVAEALDEVEGARADASRVERNALSAFASRRSAFESSLCTLSAIMRGSPFRVPTRWHFHTTQCAPRPASTPTV
jgi:hypothetical protein